MRRSNQRLSIGVVLLLAGFHGEAAARMGVQAGDPAVLSDQSFINAHPDLNFRLKGMKQLERKRADKALIFFKRAAFFADKPSQAMIATQYWEGRGVSADRALGYAWMDLASERRYPDFLLQRERYWAALNQGERERALVKGKAIYARYGDDVAQPRIEKLLVRASKRVVGSRTGYSASANILVPLPGSGKEFSVISGSQFYAPEFWIPEQYHAWHDTHWKEPRMGRVEVGELLPTRVVKPGPGKKQIDEAGSGD